jgi:hypothetical protein
MNSGKFFDLDFGMGDVVIDTYLSHLFKKSIDLY